MSSPTNNRSSILGKKSQARQSTKEKGGTSVKFSEQTEEVTFHVNENGLARRKTEDVDGQKQEEQPQEQPTVRRMKRPRPERPNADEIDDIDDYVPEEEEDDDGVGGAIPGESRLLAAKRQRRLKQHQQDDDDEEDDEEDQNWMGNSSSNTHIDNETSLASEGIPIEAFNMEEERTDGTGFFDGDTYIFRRGGGAAGINEEPDAWLDSLNEGDEEVIGTKPESERGGSKYKTSTNSLQSQTEQQHKQQQTQEKTDALSKEELYSKLLPLVSDTETVSLALVRYGQLIKQQQQQRRQEQKIKPQPLDGGSPDMAKKALHELTELASALLLKGEVSIYQKTRNDILHILPSAATADHATSMGPENNKKTTAVGKALSQAAATTSNNNKVLWEYMGKHDGQIHGLYTTQQIQGWIQLGYFVGPTAVRIRTVQDQQKKSAAKQNSLGDDLLSDLLEDDDNDGGSGSGSFSGEQYGTNKKYDPNPNQDGDGDVVQVRGEWVMSDQVEFQQYQ